MESAAQLRKKVLAILIGVALASSLWAVRRTGDWEGLALNFGTEMAGAVVTYLLLELVIRRREELEAKKANLIAQMGSSVKDVAVAAAEELARHWWLYDGSLQGAYLHRANLQHADLRRANLQGAYLDMANLQGADLYEANLQGAIVNWGVNLQRANLVGANLQGAGLFLAKLQDADLSQANLQGVNLVGANLQGAELDEDTILPDGTKWTPGTDIARFTDLSHPDLWRPDV